MTVTSVSKDAKSRKWYSVTLVGILLYVVLDAIAQSLPPHYSLLSQAESDLAVGPYGFIMTINFLNRGVLSLVFLSALFATIRLSGADVSRFRIGRYLFGVWSVGAILLAFFPTDVPPTPISWHGWIHLVVAVLAFLGGAFGALVISLNMGGNPLLERIRRFALPLATLSVLACLVELLVHSARYGGLIERVFLGTVLLWMACISVYVLMQRKEPQRETKS